MDQIRDLTDVDTRGDILTGRAGGTLSGQHLDTDSPAAYLADDEQPQFVLRNEDSGVDNSETETSEPDSGFHALAVVTDIRVLFLVGTTDGDETTSILLKDIVEASVDDTHEEEALVLETATEETWTFHCQGDVSEVATYIEEAAETWTDVSEQVDEARRQVEMATDQLDRREFQTARVMLDDGVERLQTAEDQIAALGVGAQVAFRESVDSLVDRGQQLQREIAAMKGGSHHAAAQAAWKDDHDFERAAAEYEQAVEEYERALDANGETPSVESLRARLKGVRGEREILRVAPMADARAACEVAKETYNPIKAVNEWETALSCYREAVSLDWGGSGGDFLIERQWAQKRAIEISEQAVTAHIDAGNRWLSTGDERAKNGRRRRAIQAYGRAQTHFEDALSIAHELQPERVDGIEERLKLLDRRMTGTPGPDPGEESSQIVHPVETEDPEPAEAIDDIELPQDDTKERFEVGYDGDELARAAAQFGSADESPTENGVREPTTETDIATGALEQALRALDEPDVTQLVADLWGEDGWSTTVFSATGETVYDVVATSEDGETRLLIWVVHRPDGGTVETSVIDRCATTRDSSRGADESVLITTGGFTRSGLERAEGFDVTTIDCEELALRVRQAGLAERLL